MKSFFWRFIVVIILSGMCYIGLKPTYLWYGVLSNEQKTLANINKKQLQDITKIIEQSAQFIRLSIKDPQSFSLAKSQKDLNKKKFFFDVSYGSQEYKTQANLDLLIPIIKETNPSFSDFNGLSHHLNVFKTNLTMLKDIKYYQQIKNQVIRLGLDIAGGVRFVLGIDEEKMTKMINEQYAKLVEPSLIESNIKNTNTSISKEDLKKEIQKTINSLEKEKMTKIQEEKENGIDQALVKITGRIDQFGVSEPVIIKGPNNTIVVELAGEKDVDSAKEIFIRVGSLSFRMINEEFMNSIPLSNKNYDGEVINPLLEEKNLPKGTHFLYTQSVDRFGQSVDRGALAVYDKIELDGERLSSARAESGSLGENTISFSLDSQGTKTFADLTTKNTGKRLAIVLDDKIQSAPSIREPILGGTGSISGTFSNKEAVLLSTILKSGSLPIPLKIEEERIIGPSLGQKEVVMGIHASIISLLFIIIFVFIYYGMVGGISTNIAQIFNLLLIITIMAQLGATLTLPGMAALVLTIGMSVDANVIINERIKEDIKSYQMNLPSAIESGYNAAFKTILDSNLTTFIPAFILSVIGNGAIRGFGVTLMIGLMTNLFTSIFITRLIFDFSTSKLGAKHILWSKTYGKK